jgi:hypothetical protein
VNGVGRNCAVGKQDSIKNNNCKYGGLCGALELMIRSNDLDEGEKRERRRQIHYRGVLLARVDELLKNRRAKKIYSLRLRRSDHDTLASRNLPVDYR